MEAINGVSCIKGEVHNIMTLLRLHSRWAHHLGRFSGELLIQDESIFIRSFRELNDHLEGIFDLKGVNCVMYLMPFSQVITSENASGPLTSAALSSLSKFVLYGFMSSSYPCVSAGINLIARCIPRCIFEETDWESDEVILMKLLELSSLCLRSDASCLLTVAAAWEIYETCISIHSQIKASKLLKSEAATALRHLTLTTFGRAEAILTRSNRNGHTSMSPPDSTEAASHPANHWESASITYTISGASGITLLLGKISSALSTIIDPVIESKENVHFFLSLLNVALEAGGPSLGSMEIVVEVLRGDMCRHLLYFSQSQDLAVFSLALRVVFNLFMSIKNHMKVQLEVFFTSVYLNILKPSPSSAVASGLKAAREELALESLLEFCREPSLMHDIYSNYDCDVQCTNLFDSIITTLCRRAIPSGAHSMALSSVSCISGGPHPLPSHHHQLDESDPSCKTLSFVNILNRLSLEGVLSILHAVATRCSQLKHPKIPPSTLSQLSKEEGTNLTSTTPAAVTSTTHSLDVLDVDAWCLRSEDEEDAFIEQSQALCETNYVKQGSNSQTTPFPSSLSVSSSSISQDKQSLLSISSLHAMRSETTATTLRQRKLQKQRILSAVEKFNSKPLKADWVRYASELQLLPPIPLGAVSSSGGAGEGLCDAHSIAIFLKETPGLGKREVGEYISKGPPDKYPFHAAVLTEYCNTFLFSPRTTFVEGFRQFLGHFHLPGEAQCIDRIMEAFAGRIFVHLGEGNPFVNADAAFILSFSTIMLNTDLHNTGIPMDKKMTQEEFLRNNRGINGGKDLPHAFLEELYNEIKEKQIMVDNSVTDATPVNYADTASWEKLLLHSQSNQAPASFTPTVAARRSVSGEMGLDKMQQRYMSSYGGGGSGTQINATDFTGYMTDDSTSKESDSREDQSEYNMYLHLFFPPSAHEKDMFQVMATQVLDVVLEVWETTKDDILLCKALEGLWDYANICASLNMSSHLDKMIQLLATFALSSLKNSENIVLIKESTLSCGCDGKNLDNDAELEAVLGMDFNEFFQTGGVRTDRKQPDRNVCRRDTSKGNVQPLEGNVPGEKEKVESNHPSESTGLPKSLHVYRGYILIRLLFYISNEFVSHIRKGGWLSLSTVLLWARSQNALPNDLLELFHFKNSRGVTLDPSPFADMTKVKDSHLFKKEAQIMTDLFRETEEQGSVWESVASLGGLLWSTEAGSRKPPHSDALTPRPVAHSLKGHPTKSLHFNPEGVQALLRTSLHHCRIPALLFSSSGDLPTPLVGDIIWCLLANVLSDRQYIQRRLCTPETETETEEERAQPVPSPNISSRATPLNHVSACQVLEDSSAAGLYIGRHQHQLWNFFSFQPSEFMDSTTSDGSGAHMEVRSASDVVEGDTVVVLEWVSRLLTVNRHRCLELWPYVHQYLRLILVTGGESFSTHCPYLIERVMTIILSVAMLLADADEPSKKTSMTRGQLDSQAMWESLRLMKGISHRVIFFSADRLGAGLLAFIRGHNIHNSSLITTIDEWFLVFSLLSTATVGSLGRPFVWESICYLVDNNLITSSNFTPCRNLIFRFLYRVFPSDDEDFSSVAKRKTTQQPESKEHNPWLTGALLYQMRLTLMALGGYCLATTRAIVAHNKALSKAEQVYQDKHKVVGGDVRHSYHVDVMDEEEGEDDHQIQYMQFPLPVDDMSLAYNVTFSSTNGGNGKCGDKSGGSSSANLHSPTGSKHNDSNSQSTKALQSKFSSSPLETIPSLSTASHTSTLLGEGVLPTSLVNNIIKVLCVEFTNVDDVELLWLESVKTFSDYVNTHPVEVSKNSTFCLKTIIYAAQIADIPRKCWLEALTEMLSRLPLHAEKTISHFEVQQLKQLKREQQELAKQGENTETQTSAFSLFSLGASASRNLPTVTSLSSAKLATLTAEGFDVCLQCSVIVFDTLVFHFKLLRNYEEFQPFWIKYVSILAHNVVYSPGGSLIHDESVDMIGSLFRLLHQPEGSQHSYSQLLQISWTAVAAICPSMTDYLEVNHPNIVGVVLKNQAQFQKAKANVSTSTNSYNSVNGNPTNHHNKDNHNHNNHNNTTTTPMPTPIPTPRKPSNASLSENEEVSDVSIFNISEQRNPSLPFNSNTVTSTNTTTAATHTTPSPTATPTDTSATTMPTTTTVISDISVATWSPTNTTFAATSTTAATITVPSPSSTALMPAPISPTTTPATASSSGAPTNTTSPKQSHDIDTASIITTAATTPIFTANNPTHQTVFGLSQKKTPIGLDNRIESRNQIV